MARWAAIFLFALAAAPAELLTLDGNISPVHDPVLIKANGAWYVFSTGGAIRRSKDLHHWDLIGNVFDKLPDWATTEIPGVRGQYWAPDISFTHGRYRLYYAVSTFGKNDSAIGLASNQSLDPAEPDYKWVDEGMVFRSHKGDDFNAIDPNLAVDEAGGQWLDFGSFWGGIKMRRIDANTGKLSRSDTTLYSLASRPRGTARVDSIEAPFIVHRAGYYYLFVSFDFCCKGASSSYNVVVGRSRSMTGPYVDSQGKLMTDGGGTRLTYNTSLWSGPGHEGLLLQPGGPDLMVFHAYAAVTGQPSLQISTIEWRNGWPEVAALPGRTSFIENGPG